MRSEKRVETVQGLKLLLRTLCPLLRESVAFLLVCGAAGMHERGEARCDAEPNGSGYREPGADMRGDWSPSERGQGQQTGRHRGGGVEEEEAAHVGEVGERGQQAGQASPMGKCERAGSWIQHPGTRH